MLYGVIAEDRFIEEALPVLLARITNASDTTVVRRYMNGKTDFVANFWQPAKEFQFKSPTMHKAIAVCDADDEAPAELEALLRDKATRRLSGLPFPLLFHVIRVELETWWLAEETAVSQIAGVTIPFPGGSIEGFIDPKEYLLARLPQRIPYTRTFAAEVAQRLDTDALASRCPGFVSFKEKVHNDRYVTAKSPASNPPQAR